VVNWNVECTFTGPFKQPAKTVILKWSKCYCGTKPTSKSRSVLIHLLLRSNALGYFYCMVSHANVFVHMRTYE
jgi:hypothetical protein